MTQREVVLDGGSPWGFRMHGGIDVNQPLRISRVNPGSKASLKGIREGDLISSINGQSTKEISNSEAHALLKSAGDKLRLNLNEDCQNSPSFKRRHKNIFMHQQQHQTEETVSETSKTTSKTTCTTNTTIISGENGDNIAGNKCKSSRSDNEKSSSSSLTTSPTSTLSSTTATHSCSSDTKDQEKMPPTSENQRKKRKNHKKNHGKKDNDLQTTTSPVNGDNNGCDLIYRVDSPKLKCRETTSNIVKSRSLDSDEMLKIVELKSDGETDSNPNSDDVNNAIIITENESDIEWELADDLNLNSAKSNKVNHAIVNEIVANPHENFCTRLTENKLIQTVQNGTIITEITHPPEELVSDGQVGRIDQKAQRFVQLQEYFGPIFQSPRYLDAISEEGSDISDSSVAITKTKVESLKPEVVLLTDCSDTESEFLSEDDTIKEEIFIPQKTHTKTIVDNEGIDDNIADKIVHLCKETEIDSIPELLIQELSKSSLSPSTSQESISTSDKLSTTCQTSILIEEEQKGEEKEEEEASNNEDEGFEIQKSFSNETEVEHSEITNEEVPNVSCIENVQNPDNNKLTELTEDEEKTDILCSNVNNVKISSSKEEILKEILKEIPDDIENLIFSETNKILMEQLQNEENSIEPKINEILPTLNKSSDDTNNAQDIELTAPRENSIEVAPKVILSEENFVCTLENDLIDDKLNTKLNNTEHFNKNSLTTPKTTSKIDPQDNHIESSDDEIQSYFLVKKHESSTDSDASTVKYNSPKIMQDLEEHNPLSLQRLCLRHLDDKTMREQLENVPETLNSVLLYETPEGSVKVTSKSVEVITEQSHKVEKTNELIESHEEKHSIEEVIDEEASKRLLEIIMREKSIVDSRPEVPDDEDKAEDYFHEARSRARDLNEWLQLTRFGCNENTLCDGRHRRRRRSLPTDLHVRQMQLLIEKEKHIQEELEVLELEKRRLLSEMTEHTAVAVRPYSMPPPEVRMRHQMYVEYMDEWQQRERRKRDKLIRISLNENDDFRVPCREVLQSEIEREFMEKVKEKRRRKLVEENLEGENDVGQMFQVIDDGEIYEKQLPEHLREFVNITTIKSDEDEDIDNDNESNGGIWSPGQKSNFDPEELKRELSINDNTQETPNDDTNVAPIWSPKSAGSSPTCERKEFRPVPFESPVLIRKSRTKSNEPKQKSDPPWKSHSDTLETRLSTSLSSPGFSNQEFPNSRLPKAQNPTITLLQKAREGQIPKSATYIEQERVRRKHESPYNSQSDLVYELRTESISDSDSERPKKGRKNFEGTEHTTLHGVPTSLRSEVQNEQMSQWYKKMYNTMNKQHPSKYDDDEYVLIRYKQRNRAGRYPFATGYLSEPEAGAYDSDADYNKYATLDRRRNFVQSPQSGSRAFKSRDEEYVRANSQAHENNLNKDITISYKPERQIASSPPYKPKPIEHYRPGESSIAEGEAKRWWDEVMDIFDGWLKQHNLSSTNHHHQSSTSLIHDPSGPYDCKPPVNKTLFLHRPMEKQQNQQRPKVMQVHHQLPNYQSKGYLSQALKESGYESDSTLVFRRRDDGSTQQPLSPLEQREVYKNVQKGGDVPLYGLRKPAPEKPRDCVDGEIECIPVSPTLNRLRVHRNPRSKHPQTTLCYPVQTIIHGDDSFASCKRSIPSSSTIVRTKPPSPPRRKSSRNNSTLRMIHNMRPAKLSPLSKRHQICLTDSPKTKVKALKDKISGKLATNPSEKTNKTPKSKEHKSKTYGKSNKIVAKSQPKSPVEIKRAVVNQINTLGRNGTKNGTTLLAKARNGCKTKKSSSLKSRNIASPVSIISTISRSSKSTSMDSLRSSPTISHVAFGRGITPKKTTANKNIQKSKKDQINIEKSSKKPKVLTESKQNDGLLKIIEKPIENGFFQQLFLRDFNSKSPEKEITFNNNNNNNYLTENNNYKKTDLTFGALKNYLNHTKPVSESRFKQLDVRARSVSPKGLSLSPRYYLNDHERSISLPPRLIFTKTSSPQSPPTYKISANLTNSEDDLKKIILTQTSRPISPMFRRRVPSPPVESPRTMSPCSSENMMYFSETSRPVSPMIVRRPLSPPKIHSSPSPSSRRIRALKKPRVQSFPDNWICSINNTRFQELNAFYSNLEKLGKLEKTTSNLELVPRKKFEDSIVDYERWQAVRNKEKAERELTSLYRQLKQDQRDKDFLFRPKYVESYRWKPNLDRGLRIKEKSVENLREEFEKIRKDQMELERKLREELSIKRGVYKPLWRGNSVVNLAQIMDERRSKSESRVKNTKENLLNSEKLLTYGVGSRIWSSLSMEQVNILKNQLSEIYGNDQRLPKVKERSYAIEVNEKDKSKVPKELRVRRNSDTKPPILKPIVRSQSAGPITNLTEEEKRKLSLSLSKEVLERQKNKSPHVIQAKETLGAYAASQAKIYQKDDGSKSSKSLEIFQKDDFIGEDLIDLSVENKSLKKDVWAKPKEALLTTDCINTNNTKTSSETESTEEGSVKTVIYKTQKKKVQEKVDFFETQHEREVYTPTVYKPADDSSEDKDQNGDTIYSESKLRRSQSEQDFKELFGETKLNKLTYEPLSCSRKHRYRLPKFPNLRTSNRSRSLSPVNVPELKRRFERYCDLKSESLKRCNSDPAIKDKVKSLTLKFEYPTKAGRGRSRYRMRPGVVSPGFLKAEDRYMPHINIISKIASLYPNKRSENLSRSNEDLAKILGIPLGEVHKLRERFDSPESDKMSILGHMFTSSPNINELRDVAQYLTGPWIAHKYPKVQDNDIPVAGRRNRRPKSASPARTGNRKLLSILKAGRGKGLPFRSWWNNSTGSMHYNKPTVHFQEPEGPPQPPPIDGIESSSVITNSVSDTESPRKYLENEVTIHYRSPVRQEVKEVISEDELRRRQADAMRKIYQEERQRKYLQVSHSDNELQDMKSRRHTDNFIASQKSPIPLNRYDDFLDDLSPRVTRPKSPEPRLIAKALYNFVGQSAKELTFKKGDLIYIRRQVDKNWYEGEINAMVGLFPANYVEIVPYDGIRTTPKKAHEGQARAKYNFIAQTHLELSLAKGELVVITRRVDNNWFEGRIGGRKGIFPVSYVEVLVDPTEPIVQPSKPVASPAAHSIHLNGQVKDSMGAHNYVPFPTGGQVVDQGTNYKPKPIASNVVVNGTTTTNGTYGSLKKNPMEQTLHIDIQNDPIPYRAMYKYKPQNEDELELLEGDKVHVLEKCDDGWYVGTSERTGAFGTFPGNYVERI